MTQLLLRLFVKNQDTNDPENRAAVGTLSGVVSILANLLLFGGKVVIGTISGSVAITADAMNNLSDASSAVVTMLGLRLAQRPADEDHPYGHARVEYLSGLAVAAMIIVIGFELAQTSVQKILLPTEVAFSWPVAAVLVLSIAAKLWLSSFHHYLGRHIGSAALKATAADSRNDAISTGAVLLSAIVEAVTDWHIDGAVGLIAALLILYTGGALARETINPLLGEAASPELRQKIANILTAGPKVLGFHDLMVHDYGPGQRFASVHVEMDRREDPLECHGIIDELERACLQHTGVHLVIHYDPVVIGDAKVDALRDRVLQLLKELDDRLAVHDFRMVENREHTNLIFDVELPDDLIPRKREIKLHLEARLNHGSQMKYYTVITFDPAGFNQRH